MTPIKFGTDGFRGIIDEDFNDETVRLCAYAYGTYLQQEGLQDGGVAVGYDRRFKSAEFAEIVATELGNMGITAYLFPDSVPTPVLTYSIIAKNLSGGVMITASHNPPSWNGFKIKTNKGAGAPAEVTERIEKLCTSLTLPILSCTLGELMEKELVLSAADFTDIYIEHISQLVDLNLIKKQDWRISTNPMYGAGMGFFPHILNGGNIAVEEINNENDYTFGGTPPEPVEKNLGDQMHFMQLLPCQVGLALDGDADRLAVLDENGEYLTPPQVFSLLSYYMFKHKGVKGGLVRTINASVMLERICSHFERPLSTVPVGFKHIAASMMDDGCDIGGEESGSYGYTFHMPERDGILSGLFILEFMARENKKPTELLEELYKITQKWYYERHDITYNPSLRDNVTAKLESLNPQEIMGEGIKKIDRMDGIKITLESNAWLLLRPSGTEPLIRIYAESLSPEHTKDLLAYGQSALNL